MPESKPAPKNTLSYYMDMAKFIRDPVHGYIYLTRFELTLIDTVKFQRLKDIRQLTCQHVYPAARHTRFEHSLGVLEMTRQALKNLNRNGFIGDPSEPEEIFDAQLQFNAALAALLHDIGHCPFSHLGESQFDKKYVWKLLLQTVSECPKLGKEFLRQLRKDGKDHGAVHERLSCIVILRDFYTSLAKVQDDCKVQKGEEPLFVDFELIIRSIIGFPYSEKETSGDKVKKAKNVIIQLINSNVFDMDKVDYIMRDSLMTGIGTPKIDTRRLFKNMYLREFDYSIVFTQRAEPALQNMIEARDGLYMYVYNHHAVVFSDFLFSYLIRRLDHNDRDFRQLLRHSLPQSNHTNSENSTESSQDNAGTNWEEIILNRYPDPITKIGVVPKGYLFSPEAILTQNRSDSDLICLLHGVGGQELPPNLLVQKGQKRQKGRQIQKEQETGSPMDTIDSDLEEAVRLQFWKLRIPGEPEISDKDKSHMHNNIQRAYTLVENYETRKFLKPWWKTAFEFNSFLSKYDADIKTDLCDRICDDDEFCSQIAKHVIYITKKLGNTPTEGNHQLESLEDGDFFVIPRATHFFSPDAIAGLRIALKPNEILDNPGNSASPIGRYKIEKLSRVFPQRHFYDIYEKKGFYVFSRRLPSEPGNFRKRHDHYSQLEDIFVFVSRELMEMGKSAFEEKFCGKDKQKSQLAEEKSKKDILAKFKKSIE